MSRHVRIASVLVLAAITVCVAEESVSARTYYVRKRGNDRNSGTSRQRAFKTISRAFQQRLTYGDTVYIGAGIYTKSSSVRSLASASVGGKKSRGSGRGGSSPFLTRPLRIVADTTGRLTGDRGAVVVAVADRWAVTVANNASVQFEGVTFGLPRRGGRYYGVYANGASASVTAVNCRFQNVYYGVLVNNGRLTASNCDFIGNAYGAYGSNSVNCALQNCRFNDATSIAAYLHGHNLSVSDCQFDQSKNGLLIRGVNSKSEVTLSRLTFNKCHQGLYCQTVSLKPVRDNAISTSSCNYGVVLNQCRSALEGVKSRGDTRPVSVYGGQASLARIEVTNAKSYGVYTANMEQLDLVDSRFNQTGSWAVHAHGRKMSISDSTFKRTKHGLYVRELSKTDAPVLRNMTFNGCTYGLRCDSSAVRVERKDRLAFSDCAYAVTLIDCRSTLRGMDLSGAQRPLSLHRGTAVVDGLVIRTSKSLGLYSSAMDHLSVTNSQFGATGSWALYAHGKNLSVSKSTFSGSRNGLYVQETSGKTRPVLNELGISKCAGTGLRVVSSTIDISKSSNIRVDNCGYGICLENCTSNVGGLTLASSNIPFYLRGGRCRLDGVTIEKAGIYGLLAYQMLEFSGTNVKCSGARSWGIYCYGQDFSLSDSTVSSCGHGVYVDGQGTNRSIPLANVSVQDNAGYGLYVKNASFHVVPKSTLKVLRNRGTGLYLAGKSIDLDADSGIEISDNGVGVYANRTDVKMSGFKLKGNGYGLLQYYGKLECRDSVVTGGRYGIYQRASGKLRDVGEENFVLVLDFWWSCQTSEHEVAHGKVDVGSAAGKGCLVFAAEQTVAAQPAKRAFDDPTVRKNFEPFDVVAAFHDFQFPPECLSCCFDQFAGIAAVGPDEFQSCFPPRFLEHQPGSITVLHTGSGDDHRDQQSQRVDQNMPFAAFHFLARVVSTFAPSLGGFRGLAVHDRRRCRRFPPVLLADVTTQGIVHSLPCSVVPPAGKVFEHSGIWREVMRQHLPRTARSQPVVNRIHDLTKIDRPVSPSAGGRWQLAFQNRPLLV